MSDSYDVPLPPKSLKGMDQNYLKFAISIQTTQNRPKLHAELAAELLRLKLYRDGGGYYQWLKFPPITGFDVLAVAYFEKQLIGSAAVWDGYFPDGLNFSIYVASHYRRLGIGRRLFRACSLYSSVPILVWDSPNGEREHFFNAVHATYSKARAVI